MTQGSTIPPTSYPPQVLALVAGGLGGSQMADIVAMLEWIPGVKAYTPGRSGNQYNRMLIVQATEICPTPRLALIGHSLACDTMVNGAKELAAKGVNVDLLVLIEPVWGDKALTPNVKQCLWFRCDTLLDFPKADVAGATCTTIHGDHNSICHDAGLISAIEIAVRGLLCSGQWPVASGQAGQGSEEQEAA